MSIADLFKEHFEDVGRVRVDVPEIKQDGEPLVLYAQRLTVRDRLKLRKMPIDDEPELEVEMILMKCELEDGSKAFTRDDKQVLMRTTDWRIVTRIADKITGHSLGQAEKNSEAIRSD